MRSTLDVELTHTAFSLPPCIDNNKITLESISKYVRFMEPGEQKPFIEPLIPLDCINKEIELGDSTSHDYIRQLLLKNACELQNIRSKQKDLNFTEIVDIDDEAFEMFVSEDLAARFVEGNFFRYVMIIVILLNTLMIALETNQQLYSSNLFVFSILDNVFLAIFSIEIILKWYYGFTVFWKSAWNILDFGLVVISFMGQCT